MAEEQKDIMQDVKNDDHQDNDSSYDDHDNVSLEPIVSNGSGVAAGSLHCPGTCPGDGVGKQPGQGKVGCV